MLRRAVPLLLLLHGAQSETAPQKADYSINSVVGPCRRAAGEQCGGVNGHGEVWEVDGPEASCCAEGHVCAYKTMYYSECVPMWRNESPARTQRTLEADTIGEVRSALDNFYLIINAQIVFFMQAGFAMLEVGIISPKNAKSILFKNLLDMCMVALTWWMWGFGLAGGGASGQILTEGSSFGDFGMGKGITEDGSGRAGGLDWLNSASFLHSLVFATTTTTIMSGGVAERMKVEVRAGRGDRRSEKPKGRVSRCHVVILFIKDCVCVPGYLKYLNTPFRVDPFRTRSAPILTPSLTSLMRLRFTFF
jgi:hypothetical protein